MSDFRHQHCGYLNGVFNGIEKFKRTVDDACYTVNELQYHFTHIAVSGVSGMTVGSVIAYMLGKNLIVVRKPIEIVYEGNDYDNDELDQLGYSHSHFLVEGCPIDQPFSYLVIDDFISKGTSYKRIKDSILGVNKEAKCIGAFLYLYDEFRPEK